MLFIGRTWRAIGRRDEFTTVVRIYQGKSLRLSLYGLSARRLFNQLRVANQQHSRQKRIDLLLEYALRERLVGELRRAS